jgi:hypothetical protein
MPYFVVFETRQRDAIGIFSQRGISVTAQSEDDALNQALKHFRSIGLETRAPVSVYEYEENCND